MENKAMIATGETVEDTNVVIVEAASTALSFDDFKKDLIERARKAGATCSQFTRAKAATSYPDLLECIKDNIYWCINNKVVDAEYLDEKVGAKLLWEANIYTSGKHEIKLERTAEIVMLGSSSATVETCDSSSATVKTWDSSSATVKTWDSSSATVETWGSSSATVETWGSSSATVKTCDSSSATVKTWDSSSATVKTWGSSSATVKTCDSSSKLTHALGDGQCPMIKDLAAKKLFIKTSTFEIVHIR